MTFYEDPANFAPVLSTAASLMKYRHLEECCDLIARAEVTVQNTEYDNWNGGTYGYTVYFSLSVKVYAALKKDGIEDTEKVIAETLNEVIKYDDRNYFAVRVIPKYTISDIDWGIIGGPDGKEQLKANVVDVKDIMLSVATGGARIQDVEEKYESQNATVRQLCKSLNISYNNNFGSLWDWYGQWKADLPTYQSRREYIRTLFAPTLAVFEDATERVNITDPIVALNTWDRINRTIIKIKQLSSAAQNEEDYQQVGLLCREVIISLAQMVYSPDEYGNRDEKGVEISNTDSVRMLGNYFNVKLSGSSCEELRTYAKHTNKLANMLTHKRDASKSDMLMAVSAAIALINFVGILENKL